MRLKDSIEQNNQRRGKERIPEAGIKSTFGKLEIPEYEEGFDELYCVKLENNSFLQGSVPFCVSGWLSLLKLVSHHKILYYINGMVGSEKNQM